jgi:hypothetical protein
MKARALLLRALLCVLPAALLFAFTRAHHEFWRDEAQAALIARHVPLSGLLHAMRYEGAPPGFHLLLKVLQLVLAPPTALALAGALGYAALLAGTFHLLRVVSGRARTSAVLTALLALTNTYVYELGVVCRPYGLGLGLDLAGIAELLVARRLRRPDRAVSGALLLGAAAITSDHAACVAGAALASFVLVELRRGLRLPLRALGSLPFFALTFYLMAPFEDRTPEVATAGNAALRGAFRLAGNFLEAGGLAGGWWRHDGVEPPPSWPAFRLFAAAMGIVALTRVWTRRRRDLGAELFALGTVALSWATLLYIFVAWYAGSYRHHLFLWMPALVLALGAIAGARGKERFPLLAAVVLLAPWFGYQLALARDDVLGDLRGAFTQTKATAALLPADAHVVADRDYAILGLGLWRADLSLRAADGQGRRFTYLVVDRAWHKRVTLPPLVKEECRAAPDRTFVAVTRTPLGDLAKCAARVQARAGMLPSERFDLHRVDCACALGR